MEKVVLGEGTHGHNLPNPFLMLKSEIITNAMRKNPNAPNWVMGKITNYIENAPKDVHKPKEQVLNVLELMLKETNENKITFLGKKEINYKPIVMNNLRIIINNFNTRYGVRIFSGLVTLCGLLKIFIPKHSDQSNQ